MDRLASHPRNPGMRLRVLAGLAALTVALAATAGASASRARLASFRSASGWLVEQAGADNPSLVVAVTAPDASAAHPVALFGSFKKLSRSGLLVWVDTAGRGRK